MTTDDGTVTPNPQLSGGVAVRLSERLGNNFRSTYDTTDN
jgi:hypothetical protein